MIESFEASLTKLKIQLERVSERPAGAVRVQSIEASMFQILQQFQRLASS